MKNLEIKVAVKNHKEFKSILKEMRATRSGMLSQVDTYYRCARGRLKIREINHSTAELISYKRPDSASSKTSSYVIESIPLTEVQRRKQELEERNGLQTVVEKNRELWLYKHTRIHLDVVKRLGKFLELETVIRGITVAQARTEHQRVIKLLKLFNYQVQSGSYGDLIIAA